MNKSESFIYLDYCLSGARSVYEFYHTCKFAATNIYYDANVDCHRCALDKLVERGFMSKGDF